MTRIVRAPASRGMTARLRSQRGHTMIEMMVSAFISSVFILAAGTAYLVNQSAYRRNTEKLRLQQTATLALEEMEKKIRSGARAATPSADRITVFDQAGVEITRFRLSNVGPNFRLYEQNAILAQQELITLSFAPNVDTTSIVITLTLEDDSKNRVTMRAAAALRNHPNLRNIDS